MIPLGRPEHPEHSRADVNFTPSLSALDLPPHIAPHKQERNTADILVGDVNLTPFV